MKIRVTLAMALLVQGALVQPAFGSNGTVPPVARMGRFSEVDHGSPDLRYDPPQTPSRYIVKLHASPMAMQGFRASSRTEVNAAQQARQAIHHQLLLDQEVVQFQGAAASQRMRINTEYRFDTLYHGLVVSGEALTEAKLAALPGVRAVYPETHYFAQLDASVGLIRAPAMWQHTATPNAPGQGVRIAIIDSGIRPEHAMFLDKGFPAPKGARPDDDYCAITDPGFCNNKLIVARWYEPTFEIWDQERLSPLGIHGHGTHVAGIAAGNRVSTVFKRQPLTISGVSPGAYLMVYKALFAPANQPTAAMGSNIMLLQALEDAVRDGADIINNSWGSEPGRHPAFSPYAEAIAAAEAAGVVVVQAAGNDGPGPKTLLCPACIEAGIAVANSTHGRFFSTSLVPDGLPALYARQSHSPVQLQRPLHAPIASSAQVDATNPDGCSPFPEDSFNGHIALIPRGECSFQRKLNHASDAGAKAVVFYDNQPGELLEQGTPSATRPAFMISQASGLRLLETLNRIGPLSATLQPATRKLVAEEFTDRIAASSSRGPNGEPSILKPDLAAPGTDILSATSPQHPNQPGFTFAMMTGTSMAAPHVAGAAALLRQRHPDWTAAEIKSVLTSTASTPVYDTNTTNPASPFATGAGRLDLGTARDAVLTFDKASYASSRCITRCRFMLNITNRGASEASWAVSGSVDDGEVLTSATNMTLNAGESTMLEVEVDLTFAEKARWLFGEVRFSGDTMARIPLAVFSSLSDDDSMLTLFGDAPTLPYGEAGAYHARFTNKRVQEPVTLSLNADPHLAIGPDSVQVDVTGGEQTELKVDATTNTVTWRGRLDTQQILIYPNAESPGLSQASAANRLHCVAPCDEAALEYWTQAAFEYNGKAFRKLTISSNGFIVPGEARTNDSWQNQRLPDTAPPNNVIAPFWTDLDLLGDSESDGESRGGGTLHLYEVTDHSDQPQWLVVDWINARLRADSSGRQYSFGVWLGTGPNKGTNLLQYYNMSDLPVRVTIGAEEASGQFSALYHFNGAGRTPAAGDTLRLHTRAAGSVGLDFLLTASAQGAAATTPFQTPEDTPLTIPATRSAAQYPLTFAAASATLQVEALHLVQMRLPQSALALTQAPRHGTVSFSDAGTILYTPEADFSGSDQFRYQVTRSPGATPEPFDVALTITPVNDPPVLSLPAKSSGKSGRTLKLTADIQDKEHARPSVSVTQHAGPATHVTYQQGMLTIPLPEVAEPTTLKFRAIAFDGESYSEPTAFEVTVLEDADEQQGGSGSPWLLWLLLGRWWRFRNTTKRAP
ncbi:S8 family serine peptidase [Marinobacter hydrocarbonoclasticus]|nr:S8 family serine peptidase [Marinobacter nauticus]